MPVLTSLRVLFERALPYATLGAVLGAAACEGETTTPGQLVVAIQTDMAIPKDLDQLFIEVKVAGNRHYFNEPEVGAGAGNLRLPATITLVAGDDPRSTAVNIRVASKKNGMFRALREVVTTVPAARTAMLPIQIQWLCWDQVMDEGDGNVATTCPIGETCIAGLCAPREREAPSLLDYDPKRIFGGANNPENGLCFDTLDCFADGLAAAVDLNSCSFEQPEGDLNVAIVTPFETASGAAGAGICAEDVCFVPVDSHDTYGWKVQNGRVVLPPAACDRIELGRALSIAYTTSCRTKTNAVPTCGPWSSVGSGDMTEGGMLLDRVVLPSGDGGVVTDAGAVLDSGVPATDGGPAAP